MSAALTFVLGAALGIRALAAVYAILDLRTVMSEAWPSVARGLVTWLGIPFGIAYALPSGLRGALLAGMAAPLVCQLAGLFAVRLLIRSRLAKR